MTSTSSGSGPTRSRRHRPGTEASPEGGYPPDEFDVDEVPGQRRGAHRTATPAVLEQLPFLLVALVVVVTIVVVVGLLAGGDDPGTATPTGTPSASATGEPTTPPAASTTPPATTTEPPPTSSAAPTADRSEPLVVLNGTSTSGLAGDVGGELEELGWTVETVGNAAQPAETTVVLYSDPEQQGTAEAVAADLDAAAELDDSAAGQVVVVVGADRA